jgi:hypothetical protein
MLKSSQAAIDLIMAEECGGASGVTIEIGLAVIQRRT